VIVLVVPAAGIDVGFALTVDWPASTPAAVTVTVAVCVIPVPPAIAETTLIPAAVEETVPVATPLAFVGPLGCVSVFPVVGFATSVTVAPGTGLPFASRAVTVIVLVTAPKEAWIDVGLALTLDRLALTAPADTVTVAVCVIVVPPAVAVTTLAPTSVEDSVPVATPAALVGPLGCVSAFPVPDATSDTVAPGTGLLN
jgi:hypothetical protein